MSIPHLTDILGNKSALIHNLRSRFDYSTFDASAAIHSFELHKRIESLDDAAVQGLKYTLHLIAPRLDPDVAQFIDEWIYDEQHPDEDL